MYEIYIAINQITEKVYVGFTSMGIKERFYYHEWDAKRGSDQYFHNSIRKYGGLKFFSISVICSVSTLEQAEERERFWIKYFRSNDRLLGYNMTEGGVGLRNAVQEVKDKIKRAPRKPYTEERKAKLSARFSGSGNPNFGKKHTDESRRKIREAGLGRTHTEESKRRMSESRRGKKSPLLGRKANPESIQKMLRTKAEKGLSPETRKKLSDSSKGNKNPNFGKSQSHEAKSKISEAQKSAHKKRREEKDRLIKMGIDPGPYSKILQRLGPSSCPLDEALPLPSLCISSELVG